MDVVESCESRSLSIVGPTIAMLPFVLKVTDDCVESLVGHSVWLGGTILFLLCFLHSFIFSFTQSTPYFIQLYFCDCFLSPVLKLRISFCSFWMAYASVFLVLNCFVMVLLLFLFRLASSDRVPPFLQYTITYYICTFQYILLQDSVLQTS